MGVTVYKKRGLLSKKVIALFFYKRSGYSLQVLAKLRFTSLSCGLSTAIPNAGGVSSTLLFYEGETSPFVTLYIGVKCVLRIYISTAYIMRSMFFIHFGSLSFGESRSVGRGAKIKYFQNSRFQRVKV